MAYGKPHFGGEMSRRRMRQQIPNRTITGWAALLVLAVSLFSASLLRAQNTSGSIVGTVVDSTGSVIPGASILIENTDTHMCQDRWSQIHMATIPRHCSTPGTTR